VFRYWGIGEIHIYQTNADYPWFWLLRRRQKRVHQTSIPKYIHGHAEYDQGHGHAQNTLL